MQDQNTRAKLIQKKIKEAFAKIGLDPDELIEYFPQDLEAKNRFYAGLLEFTKKYLKHQSREVMELTDDPFPPVYPFISPESDWYRFERWVRGESVRETIRAQLPEKFIIRPSLEVPDTELAAAISALKEVLAKKGFYVELQEIPDRLYYEYILDWIEEEHELCPGGGWHLDGCTGYCPGCVQRPWCETGQICIWPEDEDEGRMVIPKELKHYVSSSKHSLSIMMKADMENGENLWSQEGEEVNMSDN